MRKASGFISAGIRISFTFGNLHSAQLGSSQRTRTDGVNLYCAGTVFTAGSLRGGTKLEGGKCRNRAGAICEPPRPLNYWLPTIGLTSQPSSRAPFPNVPSTHEGSIWGVAQHRQTSRFLLPQQA